LPKPYVPKQELACDPDSIRSNISWDFEDKFLDRLEQKHVLWGDTIQEDYADDGCADGETFKPSVWLHDLVRPDYTQSLNRAFGQEVDEARLTKEALKGANKRLRKAWRDFEPTWTASLRAGRRGKKRPS
jgi:hypothetical protein